MLPTSTSCRVLLEPFFFCVAPATLHRAAHGAATQRSDAAQRQPTQSAPSPRRRRRRRLYPFFLVLRLSTFLFSFGIFFCLFVSFPCAALASWPRTPACC